MGHYVAGRAEKQSKEIEERERLKQSTLAESEGTGLFVLSK